MNKIKIKDILERSIWTFIQAFLGSFLVLAPGLLAAPNLTEAKALGVSALAACLGAGFSAVKNFIKQYFANRYTYSVK